MARFNAKEFCDSMLLSCERCGYISKFKSASNGCSKCGFHLLKVSHRGNMEKMNPFYQMDEDDPYIRQKDGPSGQNDGRGSKLTSPADEETSGGLGTRFRGKLAPRDFSSNSEETYENQRKEDIPGSYDDLLHNPPLKDDLDGWFYDPKDPLSTKRQLEEKRKFPEQSIEGGLRKQRNQDKRPPRKNDDSIFGRIKRKQKGLKR